jgi:Ca-activated chloride channel family protein
MDEQQLKKTLSHLDAPEPSKKAQDQAVSAAVLAFDKKTGEIAQGKTASGRLTDNSNNLVRRFFMESKYLKLALKSGVALVALYTAYSLSTPDAHQGTTSANALVNNLIRSSGGITQVINLVGYIGGLTLAIAATVKLVQRIRKAGKATFTGSLVRFAGAAVLVSLPFMTNVMQGGVGEGGPQQPVFMTRTSNFSGAVSKLAESRSDRLRDSKAEKAKTLATNQAPASVAAGSIAMHQLAAPAEMDQLSQQSMYKDVGRDKFEHAEENPVKEAKAEPVSTFSVDVDTASYSFMRRMINQGVLPQKDAVRPEEMINYFPYGYALPESKDEPFKPSVAVFDAPWAKGHKLIHIGIKGYDIAPAHKPHANLVFLVDTSGSMDSPDKLPLVKNALKMMLDTMSPDDTIGIVTYAGSAGTALEPTPASEKQKIIDALDNLGAGGSTAGAEGIRQAYNLAQRNLDKDGVNRVILATDGDFNVGIADRNELKSFIERQRDTGIFLSILGFGQGNYQDAMMQTLAQNGNGVAAYIDNLSEARKVLVQESSSTLFTIAKDVKIQVEFNPALVSEYRLIGYETRHLNREDFNNDKVDAGDIGAGHAVTAIYEITPTGAPRAVDDLRYGKPGEIEDKKAEDKKTVGNEYAFLKIRYKLPKENASKLIARPITASDDVALDKASDDTRFATAVAGYAELLKGSKYTGSLTYDQVIELANSARGKDEFGYRAEFVTLVRLAKSASNMEPQPK